MCVCSTYSTYCIYRGDSHTINDINAHFPFSLRMKKKKKNTELRLREVCRQIVSVFVRYTIDLSSNYFLGARRIKSRVPRPPLDIALVYSSGKKTPGDLRKRHENNSDWLKTDGSRALHHFRRSPTTKYIRLHDGKTIRDRPRCYRDRGERWTHGEESLRGKSSREDAFRVHRNRMPNHSACRLNATRRFRRVPTRSFFRPPRNYSPHSSPEYFEKDSPGNGSRRLPRLLRSRNTHNRRFFLITRDPISARRRYSFRRRQTTGQDECIMYDFSPELRPP